MNKKLIPLIGIGALAGSAACLLAKLSRLKKKATMDYDSDDELTFDDDELRPGYIYKSDLRDALRLLFRTYPDYEITGFGGNHDCPADELREYWVDILTTLLLPILNDGWEKSPRLVAYDTKVQMPAKKHGDLFVEPAFILINETVDDIDDPSCTVEYHRQLWITDSGELAIVQVFGISQGESTIGYSYLDYIVHDYSYVPWRFNELISRLFCLIEFGHAC